MTAKFIKTTSARLSEIEINAGQIIFVEDERSVYLDSESGRKAYNQIILLPTENARIALPYPLTAFYFVVETNVLWRYDGTDWVRLTTPPQQEVVFLNSEELPQEGRENVLYVTPSSVYRYVGGGYVNVGSQSWTTV